MPSDCSMAAGVLLKRLTVNGMLFTQQVEDARIEDCTIGGSETTGVQFADSQAVLVGQFHSRQ